VFLTKKDVINIPPETIDFSGVLKGWKYFLREERFEQSVENVLSLGSWAINS